MIILHNSQTYSVFVYHEGVLRYKRVGGSFSEVASPHLNISNGVWLVGVIEGTVDDDVWLRTLTEKFPILLRVLEPGRLGHRLKDASREPAYPVIPITKPREISAQVVSIKNKAVSIAGLDVEQLLAVVPEECPVL